MRIVPTQQKLLFGHTTELPSGRAMHIAPVRRLIYDRLAPVQTKQRAPDLRENFNQKRNINAEEVTS